MLIEKLKRRKLRDLLGGSKNEIGGSEEYKHSYSALKFLICVCCNIPAWRRRLDTSSPLIDEVSTIILCVSGKLHQNKAHIPFQVCLWNGFSCPTGETKWSKKYRSSKSSLQLTRQQTLGGTSTPASVCIWFVKLFECRIKLILWSLAKPE